ncbi:uncharacterized protein LOC143187028 [Calliopsis andreniformis]|uniref:uncharacterized protein LOC143187028 n=1 Tax=Calliopsis andreniformis TaxID=337506 RepID=UPI003FCE6F00
MRGRSLRISLLKLVILIYLTSMVFSRVTNEEGRHHHHRSTRIHYSNAVSMSRKFVCKEPQPRAYHLNDLIQKIQPNPAESASQPIYIVLKRCDGHSGCCYSSDMSCSPVQSSIYYEELEILMWNLVINKTRKQWIKVEQHGECSCEFTTISDRYEMEHQQPEVILL